MKQRSYYRCLIVVLSLLLVACGGDNYAPVTDISMMEAIPTNGTHKVLRGETLYEIAWRFGLDYRTLATRNHIEPPYTVYPGQVIHLRGGKIFTTTSEENPAIPVIAKPKAEVMVPEPTARISKWMRPARGAIIKRFSTLNKGINISGVAGDPIYATAAGKVVYAGDGLRRYGKLIIIKHNSLFLSAYAHNSKILVKEGEWVTQGQKIAEMGNTGTDKVMVHFEIRRAGKPINPAVLLSA